MNLKPKIRVLLVDDSPIALHILEQQIADAPDIAVVGKAANGLEALELVSRLKPDVVCTDYHMPRMDGLALTQRLMAEYPLPILVISVSVQNHGDEQTIFSLMEAGALDVLPKPRGGEREDLVSIKKELISKIRILSGVHVFRRPLQGGGGKVQSVCSPEAARMIRRVPVSVVAIGTSTGGPPALQTILSQLPASFPAPILCVQHISKGFLDGLVAWLQKTSPLRIKIAEEGERALPGTVYLAPDEHHLTMDICGVLRTTAAPLTRHIPSVTVTFHSLAESCGNRAIAILLTGMGDDGAEGLRDIADVGGITIAQDEASCAVFGMPKTAIEIGAARFVMPLTEIAARLQSLISRDVHSSGAGEDVGIRT